MKILITGTTRGIGKSIFEQLSYGNDVYTINKSAAESEKNYLCDLSDLKALADILPMLQSIQPDILINNAGGAEPRDFEQISASEAESCMRLNFLAPAMIMQALLPEMKNKRFGRIVNISSVTSKTPAQYLPFYGAAKAALDNLAKGLAPIYGPFGITINNICPGAVSTETAITQREKISRLHGLEKAEYQSRMAAGNGIMRMVRPEEIADAVRFLISSSAITGQTLNVCGTMEVH